MCEKERKKEIKRERDRKKDVIERYGDSKRETLK